MEDWTKLNVNRALVNKTAVVKEGGRSWEGRIVDALSEETVTVLDKNKKRIVSIFDIVETK